MYLQLNIKTQNALTSLSKISDQNFENSTIDFSDLPDFKSVKTKAVNSRYLQVLRLLWLFFFILYITLVILVYLIAKLDIVTLILVTLVPLVILTLSFLEIEKGFKLRQIGVRQHDLYYARGFLYHKETLVPFKHIQHVEVSQNIFLKWFRLYKLVFYTAGASSGDLRINGLDEQTSRKLKAIVMQKNESVEEKSEQL